MSGSDILQNRLEPRESVVTPALCVSPASIGYVDVHLTLPHACGNHRVRTRWSTTFRIKVRINPTARAGKLPNGNQAMERADDLGVWFVPFDVRGADMKLRLTYPASAKNSVRVLLVREIIDELERLAGVQIPPTGSARRPEFDIAAWPHRNLKRNEECASRSTMSAKPYASTPAARP